MARAKIEALWGPSDMKIAYDRITWIFTARLTDGSPARWRLTFSIDTRMFQATSIGPEPSQRMKGQADLFPPSPPHQDGKLLRDVLREQIPPAQLAAAISAAIQAARNK